MTARVLSDFRRKIRFLNYTKEIVNVSKAYQYYGVSRETYYQWKRAYEKYSEQALMTQNHSFDDFYWLRRKRKSLLIY